MQRVLTLTTNPALDMATGVTQVVAGPKLRCTAPRWDPGGGGVNVARAITRLGGQALAMVAVGGAMGQKLLALLAAEDVAAHPIAVSAETRISFAVTDATTQAQFRFGLPGEALSAEDRALILTQIAEVATAQDLLVFSGSVAPGLPDDFVAQIHRALASQGTRLVVDTSGPALHDLIARPQGVHVLRLDLLEAEACAARPLTSIEETAQFARALVDQGVAEIVVMGRGADGSVLVTRDAQLHAWGPPVEVRSKIGAGDTFVGAFALGLARHEPLPTALMRGVAGAAATVMSDGTALCLRADFEAIFAGCRCEAL